MTRTLKSCVAVVIAVAFLSSCAGFRPIVDTRNIISMARYEQDVAECQAYAKQINPAESAVTAGAISAVVGGVLVALIGVALGAKNSGGYVAAGAVGGGIQGAAAGGGAAMIRQETVICNCLRARGYDVLE